MRFRVERAEFGGERLHRFASVVEFPQVGDAFERLSGFAPVG